MSTRIRADAQKLTHDNFTAAVGPVTKTLPAKTNFLLIENMDSTNSIKVSFDAGVTFKDIGPGKALSLDIDGSSPIQSYAVKSSASTPAAQCLYGSEL